MTDRITSNQTNPTVRFVLEADATVEASYGDHGRWKITFYLRAENTGTTASAYNGAGTQDARGNGTVVGSHSGNPFLPGGVAAGARRWRDGPYVQYRNANSNGYWNSNLTAIAIQMGLDYGSVDILPQYSLNLGRIARVPGAPGWPSSPFTNPAPTGVTVSWTAAKPGNDPIDRYDLQYSTSSSFSSPTTINAGNKLTTNVTGLSSGTTYYFRARAVNGDGGGAWSSTQSFTAIPSGPPTVVSVQSSASGTTSTVTVAPPPGTATVDTYTIERLDGDGLVLGTYQTMFTRMTIGALTPGETYGWRVNARIGTYISGWSPVVTATQANPNTNPGDYFDGSFAPKTDGGTPPQTNITYRWGIGGSGTPNLSASEAVGVPPTGWTTFAGGAVTSGGTGVIHRYTGGLLSNSGNNVARVIFFTAATAAGFFAGQSGGNPGRSAIAPNASYEGAIHISIAKRTQHMVAMLRFYDTAGTIITTIEGNPVDVPADTVTRIAVTATSPPNAAYAAVDVRDVAGGAWALWEGGDSFLMDAAILSVGSAPVYFDGDTPDTTSYDYEWLPTPHASPSRRLQIAPTPVDDPLLDPDCDPLPLPPRPPTIPADCIEEVGTWTRFFIVIPKQSVSQLLVDLPSFLLSVGVVPVRQVRIRITENPLELPYNQVDTSTWVSEQIVSYIPPNTLMTIDGVRRRVTAEVGGADPAPADHLLYGTGGSPATWPELGCGIAYLVTVDVPLDLPGGNFNAYASLTRRF